MIFDYNKQEVFTKSIDVVDIGNTALRASSDEGIEYYIVTKTVMGKTSIIKFGPMLADIPMLLDGFTVTYQKIDFKEQNISKNINMFINEAKKKISNVDELTEYEAFEAFPDIVTAFNSEEGE